MLRPDQTLRMPARSPTMTFHLIEGGATVQIGARQLTLAVADTCCAPGYTAATLTNLPASTLVFLFLADKSTLQRRLSVYEIRY